MDFRLLGPLEVTDGQERLALGGPKPRTLLAHLVLELGRVVPAERLIEAVWDERPPPAARNTLQTYVSHLRQQLGAERLRARAGGYVLEGERREVDVYRFEQLLADARAAADDDPAAAVHAYRSALAQWRGPALDDLAEQPSLRADIARLEELRLAALEERLGKELELGRHADVVAELEWLTVRHPLRESLWAHLMVALYRSGRQADALAAFERARQMLAQELGIDPSPQLQRLHEQMLRQDLALDVAGTPLRGYRLLEQVGAGTVGVVHRGFDTQMGREVAIKAIHPRLANDAEFIRRFEAEAQQIARLEHPHLVPLHDYWREPDGAYLVMRYLRGGSLRDALADGRLDPEAALGVLADIGEALSAAHAHGVVHRDLKPENILLDEAGNAYLSDFGLAADLDKGDGIAGRRTAGGLRDYRSPEEARGEPATARSDLYSLGVVARELLTGHHPDAPAGQAAQTRAREPVRSGRAGGVAVAAVVDGVLARAAATDPQERFGDAAELVAALRTALADATAPAAAVPGAVTRNPYKGLRAFDEADAADFCGREALVDRLVARLAEAGAPGRFVAVVGPSGSGKSSLVRAGLVPALRRGAVAGSQRWFVAAMLPGHNPFAEFQAALLRVAARPLPAHLIDRLGRDPHALARAAAWVLPGDGAELLVLVDQFEEVFTRVEAEASRVAFLRSLVAAAGDSASRVRVVVTLRADFYDRPLRHPGLAELVRAHTEAVVPLSAEELERAVTVPARQVGVDVEAGLVARIAADVADQPGALPLVQYALTELFDQRADATLTLAAYREIGGVAGALTRRAEELYAALPDPARQAARQLFLRLVAVGDGSEDTRRRVARRELESLPTEPGAMDAAVEAFGQARLLSFDRDPATRQPMVEVAHEALLREWVRLRTWVDRARDDLRVQRRLAAAAGDWVDAGRDGSFLAAGSRLEQFAALAARTDVALTADERAFVDASLAERDRRAADEAARQERERELERRSLRRLRALVAVFAVAALIAGGLTVVALRLAAQRAEQLRITTARELATAALANLDVDPERAILLALEAVDTTRAADGTVLPEAEETLHRAVKSSRLMRTFPQGGYGLAISPDATRLVSTGADPGDNTATVWDLETGEQLFALVGPDVGRVLAEHSPDGRLIATTHNDGTVWLWDAATGERLQMLEGHDGWINLSAFSPDGRWLATTGDDGTVRVWDVSDVATNAEGVVLTGHDGRVFDVAFSPDGTRLASISADGTIRVWDPTTGETVDTLTDWTVEDFGGFGFHYLAYSPDGNQIAATSGDRTIRFWDADTGAPLLPLYTDTGARGVAYSSDGTRVAAGSSDATATVWDAQTGRRLLTLAGHTAEVNRVAFTPDGQRLLTASSDDTTRMWDLSAVGTRDWLTVAGPAGRWATVAFAPDGTRFAVPADPKGVTIHDADTGEVVDFLSGHDAAIMQGLAFSPDGGRLAAAGFTGDSAATTAPVWDVDSGDLLFELVGHDAEIVDVAFSPDGRRLATAGGEDGTVRLWDAASGMEQRVLHVADEWAGPVAFSPDGRLVAAHGAAQPVEGASLRHELGVFDTDTGERLHKLEDHPGWGTGLVITPDGQLVTASSDGLAIIWDLATGQAAQMLRHDSSLWQVAVSPDGTRIATATHDGTARLWDPDTGRQVLALYGHDAPVFGVAFSPDGRLLATSSEDGTVALHLLPIDEFVDLARTRVARGLTDDECRQYLRLHHCLAR